jgi:hypothetical protein
MGLEGIREGNLLATTLEADRGGYFWLAGPILKRVLRRHLDAVHATLNALLDDVTAALGQPKGESG